MDNLLAKTIQWWQGMAADIETINMEEGLIPEVEENDTNGIITHPSYDAIHKACLNIAEQLDEKRIKPDLILGLSRGGLLPAVILSNLLDIKMRCVHYSSMSGKGDNKNHTNDCPEVEGKSILIVDDICDSGHTLSEVYKTYTLRKHFVSTAAVYYKDNPTGFMPDVYWHWIPQNSPWIIYPWEQ